MPFKTRTLAVRRDEGSWRTQYLMTYYGDRDVFMVPAGTFTDFATIPRLLRWLLDVDTELYVRAAVLHDWLCIMLGYKYRAVKSGEPLGSLVNFTATSREVDGLFRRVAREEGTPLLTRWLLWTGVRWGALANPARRSGWWRDAPAVLLLSLLALPLVALPALSGALGRLLFIVAETLVGYVESFVRYVRR